MNLRPVALPIALFGALFARTAAADTLKVGPGLTYTAINDAVAAAKPGDVVEVQGDQTYHGMINFRSDNSGTADQPITVRGIIVNGKRPILTGIGTGQYDNIVVLMNANHFVLETFEVIGDRTDTNYCIVHKADDVKVRDVIVHDCYHQGGFVSTDTESGSATVEYCEFYHNGSGDESHQLYPATDESMYPHSVFRIQYSYIHDGVGGNNIQSRAERNEIYYNWMEGAFYHQMSLVGPDVGDENLAREDSDVVGNVFVNTSEWRVARIGGDCSGNTAGRYRFVNNTMVMNDKSTAVITLQETVQSLEMYNNVIWGTKAGFKVYEVTEPSGPAATLFGSNNWVMTGTTSIPASWTATTQGADPGWVDPTNHDLRPTTASPLVDQGTTTTAATGALAFPNPLALPAFHPPQRRLASLDAAEKRTITKAPDIGAFEDTAATPGAPPPDVGPAQPGTGGSSGAGGGDGGAGANKAAPKSDSGCGCIAYGRQSNASGWAVFAAAIALLTARRRRCGGDRKAMTGLSP
jgi:hypothetical protein